MAMVIEWYDLDDGPIFAAMRGETLDGVEIEEGAAVVIYNGLRGAAIRGSVAELRAAAERLIEWLDEYQDEIPDDDKEE